MPAATTSTEEDESVGDNQHHPWFGPKRIGYGLRPQTWQGWAIVLAFCAVVVVIALLLRQ